jgi:diphthine-ammonia ligase
MCGIAGSNQEKAEEFVKSALQIMQNRGKDASHIINHKKFSLGHNLHAIINHVQQPIETETHIFATNCEIYNWKEIAESQKIQAENDAELLCKLLVKKGISALEYVDGVYAFALYEKTTGKITLARDIIGEKPLFYCEKPFAFASEKKSIPYPNVKALNPRQILIYAKKIKLQKRSFFKLEKDTEESYDEIKEKTRKLLTEAIKKRIPEKKFGILFSGGIDSTILAYICKKLGYNPICYVAGIGQESADVIVAKEIAEKLNFTLKVKIIEQEEVEKYIKTICPIIESNNVVKVGVAIPFFIAAEEARRDGIKVLFSGLGSEELFAGYDRHAVSAGIGKDDEKIENVNKECLSGITQIHERDLYRDDVVTMYNQIELRLPFLDLALIEYALKIPAIYKISKDEKKIILRDVAEDIGIPRIYARRPKKAAQYGSRSDKAIAALAKKQGYSRKSEYLHQFYKEKNLRLGALISSGKDGWYAAYVMSKQNYEIACAITMYSQNQDSYMFHTPNVTHTEIQAEAAEIPLVIGKTEGKKEIELEDLRKTILQAKVKYQLDGIVSGAIFSTYQRDRIEKICDELGLVSFAPL